MATRKITTLELQMTGKSAQQFLEQLKQQADSAREKVTGLVKQLSELKKSAEYRNNDTVALRQAKNLETQIRDLTEQAKLFKAASEGQMRSINAMAKAMDNVAGLSLKQLKAAMKEYDQMLLNIGKDVRKDQETLLKYGQIYKEVEARAKSLARGITEPYEQARKALAGFNKPVDGIRGILSVVQSQLPVFDRMTSGLSKWKTAISLLDKGYLTFGQDYRTISDQFRQQLGSVEKGTQEYQRLSAAFKDLGSTNVGSKLGEQMKSGLDAALSVMENSNRRMKSFKAGLTNLQEGTQTLEATFGRSGLFTKMKTELKDLESRGLQTSEAYTRLKASIDAMSKGYASTDLFGNLRQTMQQHIPAIEDMNKRYATWKSLLADLQSGRFPTERIGELTKALTQQAHMVQGDKEAWASYSKVMNEVAARSVTSDSLRNMAKALQDQLPLLDQNSARYREAQQLIADLTARAKQLDGQMTKSATDIRNVSVSSLQATRKELQGIITDGTASARVLADVRRQLETNTQQLMAKYTTILNNPSGQTSQAIQQALSGLQALKSELDVNDQRRRQINATLQEGINLQNSMNQTDAFDRMNMSLRGIRPQMTATFQSLQAENERLSQSMDKSAAKIKELASRIETAKASQQSGNLIPVMERALKQATMTLEAHGEAITRNNVRMDKMVQSYNSFKTVASMSDSELKKQEQLWTEQASLLEKDTTRVKAYQTALKNLSVVQQQQKTNAMNNIGLSASAGGNVLASGGGILQQLNDTTFPKTVEWLNKARQSLEEFKNRWADTRDREGLELLRKNIAEVDNQLKVAQGSLLSYRETWAKVAEIERLAAGGHYYVGTSAEIEKATASLKALETELKRSGAGEAEIQRVQTAMRNLKGAIDTTKISEREFEAILRRPKDCKDLEKLTVVLNTVRERARAAGSASAQQMMQMKNLDRQVKQLNQTFGYHASALEQAMSRLKSYVMIYMGFNALMMKARQAVTSNLELADAMSKVQKVAQIEYEQIQQLSDSLQQLNTRTSQAELMQIAYQGAKMGVAVNGGRAAMEQFVESANKLNSALGEDFGGAEAIGNLTKLSQVMKITGENNEQLSQALEKTGSAILMLGNSSTANYSYIEQFASRLGGIASAAHITMPDLLAIGSTLDTMKMPVEMASTAMSKFIATLSKKPENIEKAIGLDTDTLKNLVEADDTMGALVKVFEQLYNKKANLRDIANVLKDLVGGGNNTRALQVITNMANGYETLAKHIEISNDAYERGTDIQREYEIQNENAMAYAKRTANAIANIFSNSATSDLFGGLFRMLSEAFEYFNRNKGSMIAFFSAMVAQFTLLKSVTIGWKITLENVKLTILSIGKALKNLGLLLAATVVANNISKIFEKVTTLQDRMDRANGDMEESIRKQVSQWDKLVDRMRHASEGSSEYLRCQHAIVDKLREFMSLEQLRQAGIYDEQRGIINLSKAYEILTEKIRQSERAKVGEALNAELEGDKARQMVTQRRTMATSLAEMYINEQGGRRKVTGSARERADATSYNATLEARAQTEADKLVESYITSLDEQTSKHLYNGKRLNPLTGESLAQEASYSPEARRMHQLAQGYYDQQGNSRPTFRETLSSAWQYANGGWQTKTASQVKAEVMAGNPSAHPEVGYAQAMAGLANLYAQTNNDQNAVREAYGVREKTVDELVEELGAGEGLTGSGGGGSNLTRTDISQRIAKAIQDAIKDSQEQIKAAFNDRRAILNEQFASTADVEQQSRLMQEMEKLTQQESETLEQTNRYVYGMGSKAEATSYFLSDEAIKTIVDSADAQLKAGKMTQEAYDRITGAASQLGRNQQLASSNAERALSGRQDWKTLGILPRTKANKEGGISSQEYVDEKNLTQLLAEIDESIDKSIAEDLQNQTKVDAERAKRIRTAILEGDPLAKVKDDFATMLDNLDIFYGKSTDYSEQAFRNRMNLLQAMAARITTLTYDQYKNQLHATKEFADLDAAQMRILYDKLLQYRDDYDNAARKKAKQDVRLLDNRVESGQYYADQLISLKVYLSTLDKESEAYMKVAKAIEVVKQKQNDLVNDKESSYYNRQQAELENRKTTVKQEEAIRDAGGSNSIQLARANAGVARQELSIALEKVSTRQSLYQAQFDAMSALIEKLKEEHADMQLIADEEAELAALCVMNEEAVTEVQSKALEAQTAYAEKQAELITASVNKTKEWTSILQESMQEFAKAGAEAYDSKSFELAELRAKKELGLVADTQKQRFLIIKKNGEYEEQWLNQEEHLLTQREVAAQNERNKVIIDMMQKFGEKLAQEITDAFARRQQLQDTQQQKAAEEAIIQQEQQNSLTLQMKAELQYTEFYRQEIEKRLQIFKEGIAQQQADVMQPQDVTQQQEVTTNYVVQNNGSEQQIQLGDYWVNQQQLENFASQWDTFQQAIVEGNTDIAMQMMDNMQQVADNNSAVLNQISKSTDKTNRRIEAGTKSTATSMINAMNLYGAAYNVVMNDNLSATQKFGLLMIQAIGQVLMTVLTSAISMCIADSEINLAEAIGKVFAQLGTFGWAAVAAVTATIGAGVALATKAVTSAQKEIAQATGAGKSGKLATGMLTYASGRYEVEGNDGKTYDAEYAGNVSELGTQVVKGTHFGIFSEVKPEMVIDGDTTKLMHDKYPLLENAILSLHKTGSLSMQTMLGLDYASIGKTISTLTRNGSLGGSFRMPTFASGRYPDYASSTTTDGSLNSSSPSEAFGGSGDGATSLVSVLSSLQQTLANGIGATVDSSSASRQLEKQIRFEQRNKIKRGLGNA